MSSFQQGILDLDKEYIMQRVESCVSFLEHLGHSVEIAKWDATKLRQGKNVLTLAMDATFGNIDNSGIVGFEGDENVADYALIV
jgi:chromosome condensin MukBEF MukE localization factor